MGRYIILGAGAIGSVFGGLLARGGNSVTLVGRRPHMDIVRASGLRIHGLLGEHMVRGIDAESSVTEVRAVPVPDAVLVCVKSFDTDEAARQLAASSLVGPDTAVVSLQNGLGNLETLQRFFGIEKTLGGRVIFGAEVTSPGEVLVTVWAEQVLLGGADRVRAESLATEFTRCGIETGPVADISAALWGKILYNAGLNSLSALLEVPYGTLGEEPSARSVLVRLIREAHAVAEKESTLPWAAADEYLDVFFSRLLPSTAAHQSSMLQDIRRGRRTEVEAINGEVVRRGKRHGVPTPANSCVYELVKAKEGIRGLRTE